MAITPNYEHTANLLSIIKNGSSIYYIKDADLRKIVEGFGDATAKDVATAITENNADLATSGSVYSYVKTAVADLAGAMHFRDVVTPNEGESDLEALARVITDPAAGDIALVGVKEYVYGGSPAKWNELGDENIYLTKTTAGETYVAKSLTVAGINLQDDITVEELQKALKLGSLAYKSSASGSISTIDSIDDITVAKADTYTVSGTAVAVPTAFSALDVTPAGTIAVSAGTAASATYDKATSATITSAESKTGNYTPAGSITLPDITVTHTPSTEKVQVMSTAGTGYSITDGSVTKGKDTTGKFATTGLKAAYTAADETLAFSVLEDSDKASAVTASGSVSYTAPVLSGSLPTFAEKTVVTGIGEASAKYVGDASFSGTQVQLSAGLGYTTSNATVTQPTFTAEFSGTTKTVTPVASTTANAAPFNATVTVEANTVSIVPHSSGKTVTVK